MKKAQTRVVGKINIEALVNKSDKPTAAVITSAVNKLKAEQAEKQEKDVLKQLAYIQRKTGDAVSQLKRVRETERRVKASLQKIAEAEQAFLQNADWDAYEEAMHKAGEYCSNPVD